jgi:L-ascorbate oxidase
MPPATLTMLLNITQPLMNQTGQLRWAINNVAMQSPPPCEALLDLVYE